jgi:hypothetical protein
MIAKAAPRVRRFIRSEENLSIVEAMDHPGLFAQWFAGPSWDGWRAVLKGAFALPMSSSDHPPNAHDDVANAAAGALVTASQGALGMSAVPISVWEEALAAASNYRYEPPPFREGQIFHR